MNEQDRADLSAFFDDEPVDMNRVASLLSSEEGRAGWARQCLVRDALRGDNLAGSNADIAGRVRDALADEPVVFNPGAQRAKPAVGGPVSRNRQFAGLALAATVAGVAFLGLTQFNDGAPGSSQVAGSNPVPTASDFPPVNGIGGAVVNDDVRPVTRIVGEDEETLTEDVRVQPATKP